MSYLYVKWNSFRCGSLADDSVIRAWFVFAGRSRVLGESRPDGILMNTPPPPFALLPTCP